MLISRIMCGRYSAVGTLDEFAKMIGFNLRVPFFAPRYNIAPRQQAPVLVLENGEPTMKLMRWGLIPGWAKDESIGDKLINARAETISEKTSFKKPFEFQRCLVVADGFYEWQLSGTKADAVSVHDEGQIVFLHGWTLGTVDQTASARRI